jgi:hypothetical protein
MSREGANSPRNRLLALLPKSLEERMVRDCETVHLGLRDVVYEANKPISNVYFPFNGVISVIATMDDGMEMKSPRLATKECWDCRYFSALIRLR